MIVHVLSQLAEKINGEPPVIEAGKIRLDRPVKAAKLVYPEEKALEVLADGSIVLPPIRIHEVVEVEA